VKIGRATENPQAQRKSIGAIKTDKLRKWRDRRQSIGSVKIHKLGDNRYIIWKPVGWVILWVRRQSVLIVGSVKIDRRRQSIGSVKIDKLRKSICWAKIDRFSKNR